MPGGIFFMFVNAPLPLYSTDREKNVNFHTAKMKYSRCECLNACFVQPLMTY